MSIKLGEVGSSRSLSLSLVLCFSCCWQEIPLLTLVVASAVRAHMKGQKASGVGVCVALSQLSLIFFGIFPDLIWKRSLLLVSRARWTRLSPSSSCCEHNSYFSLMCQLTGVTTILGFSPVNTDFLTVVGSLARSQCWITTQWCFNLALNF